MFKYKYSPEKDKIVGGQIINLLKGMVQKSGKFHFRGHFPLFNYFVFGSKWPKNQIEIKYIYSLYIL